MVPEPEPKKNYDTGITNCGLGIAESSPELQKNVQQSPSELPIPDFIGAFRETYRREFGFDLTGREIIVDDLRVRAVAKSPGLQQFTIAENSTDSQGRDEVPASKQTRLYFSGGWFDTPIYRLEKLGAGLVYKARRF